jgi:hypothetical protein
VYFEPDSIGGELCQEMTSSRCREEEEEEEEEEITDSSR